MNGVGVHEQSTHTQLTVHTLRLFWRPQWGRKAVLVSSVRRSSVWVLCAFLISRDESGSTRLPFQCRLRCNGYVVAVAIPLKKSYSPTLLWQPLGCSRSQSRLTIGHGLLHQLVQVFPTSRLRFRTRGGEERGYGAHMDTDVVVFLSTRFECLCQACMKMVVLLKMC